MSEIAYSGFGTKEWIRYYESLNKELPAEKCGLDLTEEEKKGYNSELARLKEERKKIPGVSFDVRYSEFE